MEIHWLGPYQLVRALGRGGMGVVYEGVDVETGQRAALKVLPAALNEEEDFRTRFESEIETLRRLKHPNIVRLYGFGQQDGVLFYAMELVDGPSLQAELRRGRRFSWQEAAQISLQICRGLRHAHDRGVIHRDLKPGNLLMAADGTIKLADFGIAQLFGRTRVTAVGSVVGTLDYMAPEQAEGGLVDARADLYSLGAVLYALLSGGPPLRAKTLAEMLEKLYSSRPAPIRRLAPETPEALEQLLDQLLEKDPERRIATALAAARRLETLLQEAELSAPPSPPDELPAGVELRPERRQAESAQQAPSAESSEGDWPMAAESSGQEKVRDHEASGVGPEAGELPETKPMTWPPGTGGPSEGPSSENLPGAIRPGEQGEGFVPMEIDSLSLPPMPEEAEQASASQLAPTQQATPPALRQDMPSDSAGELGSAAGHIAASDRAESTRPANKLGRPSHFTPVSEQELDQIPVEEPPRPWISWQTWFLAGGLLAIGITVWYLLQPPSADRLYERIMRTAEEGTIDALRAAEPAIQEFLSRYPSDSRAEQIRQYERELDLDRLERRFELQASGRLRIHPLLSPVERAYAEAVAIARSNPDLGVVKLQALLDLYENQRARSGPTGACLELARRRLQRLRQEIQQRASGALQVLEERLHRAEELEKNSPQQARAIRQAIVDLYADKPWAAPAVAQAQAALAKSPPQSSPAQPTKAPENKDAPGAQITPSQTAPSLPNPPLQK